MKLPHNTNPALVASKDPVRHILHNCHLRGNLLLATDGRRALAIKIEREEDDDPRPEVTLRVAAIKEAIKQRPGGRKNFTNLHLRGRIQIGATSVTVPRNVDETIEFKDGASASEAGGRYPNVAKVLPDISLYTGRLNFNAELLAGLAAAMGADQITLHYQPQDPGACLLVTASTENGAAEKCIGMLMPTRATGAPLSTRTLADNSAVRELLATPDLAPA
jgi:hypothetical protein